MTAWTLSMLIITTNTHDNTIYDLDQGLTVLEIELPRNSMEDQGNKNIEEIENLLENNAEGIDQLNGWKGINGGQTSERATVVFEGKTKILFMLDRVYGKDTKFHHFVKNKVEN